MTPSLSKVDKISSNQKKASRSTHTVQIQLAKDVVIECDHEDDNDNSSNKISEQLRKDKKLAKNGSGTDY